MCSKRMKFLVALIVVLAFAAPYAIIVVLMWFNPGAESKTAQRRWTMSWLVASQVCGFVYGCGGAGPKFKGWVCILA